MNAIFEWISENPLLTILILVVIYGIFTYNNLNSKKQRVNKSFSTIDVYLEKRFDMIKSLLDQTMNAYQHEEKVFTEVSRLRTGITKAQESGNINDKVKAANDIQGFIASPLMRTEAYPELKSISEMGIFTAQKTSSVEDELGAARLQYNANATSYNTKISSFPAVIIAKLCGFKTPFELFKANDAKREAPQVQSVSEYNATSEAAANKIKQAAEAQAKVEAIAQEAAVKAAEAAVTAQKDESVNENNAK